VTLSPISRGCEKCSRDGSLANQVSQFLIMFTIFVYKTSRFILRVNLGEDLFNVEYC
jgi:hypothetical protein